MATLETMQLEDTCEGETQIIKAFLYHRVTDDRSVAKLDPLCVHEADFMRQLELLDRWGFTTITFKDYQLFLQQKLHLPKKPVILTLDNSTEESYRVALPLLREVGSKAVFFVPADPAVRLKEWGTNRGYRTPMSPSSLRHAAAEGMEIGSASLCCRLLPQMSHDDARDDVVASKQMLEMAIGAPVVSFAYPYGHVNASVKRMVKEAGFAFACGWSTGPATFGEDHFEIRRFSVHTRLGAVGFRLRLHVPFEFYEQCVQRTRTTLARMNHRVVIRP